jgi:DNA repair protein RecO (recombination protein O)
MCWQGKDLDVVTQVETIDNFRICREDFSRMVKAMSMLEVVDHFQQERMADPGVYKMLIGALGALTKADAPLIMPAFFLKLLALEGYSPKVDCCVRCSAKELLVGFDFESAGLLCKRCLEVESSSDNVNGYGPRRKTTPLSSGAVQLVSAILGTGLGWALNCATGTLADEVAYLATRAVEHHLGRPVRSLSFVKELVI